MKSVDKVTIKGFDLANRILKPLFEDAGLHTSKSCRNRGSSRDEVLRGRIGVEHRQIQLRFGFWELANEFSSLKAVLQQPSPRGLWM